MENKMHHIFKQMIKNGHSYKTMAVLELELRVHVLISSFNMILHVVRIC